ncbi:MAG: hypothetical protein M1135_01125 [Candidatus Omnitrophica bacterium]|nr:hypothetical protein [Candidatus Omnitrophota bacterium]
MDRNKRFRTQMIREVYGSKAKEHFKSRETKYSSFKNRYLLLQERLKEMEKKHEHIKK